MRRRHKVLSRTETTIEVEVLSPNGRPHKLTLPLEGYHRWMDGALVQEAFPDLPIDQREILITGYDGEEFDALFRDH